MEQLGPEAAAGVKGRLSLPSAAVMPLIHGVFGYGAAFRFRAHGSSMLPLVRDGDLISISPLEGPPRVGDVVAFVHPQTGGLVVHRVVGFEGELCVLRGDNDRSGPGERVSRRVLLGRLIEVQRHGRRVRFGLGPERRIVGLLSRLGWLPRLTQQLRRLRRALRPDLRRA